MIETQDNKENKIHIKKATTQEIDSICTEGLTQEQIELQKKKLIKNHIGRTTSQLTSAVSEQVKQLCISQIYFINTGCKLVLCGLYCVRYKRDRIGEHISMRDKIYDYLFYSKDCGFYYVLGCSMSCYTHVAEKNITPTVYYENQCGKYLLDFGRTYEAECFQHIYALFNQITYQARDTWTYDIHVFWDDKEKMYIPKAYKFFDCPMAEGFFVYSMEKSDRWKGSNYGMAANIFTMKVIPLFGPLNYHQTTTLSCIMANADNPELRISDSENIYFYVCKNETYAFEAVMRCAQIYGKVVRIKNLFPEDNTVNYKITFSHDVPDDVVSFVNGVIHKSKVLYPAIFGCEIHDVVEVLCRDNINNPYELPQHSIDEVSAQNVIEYIREKKGELSNGDIVYLLAKTYGSYSTMTRCDKYWIYYHGESLKEEELPTSMENVIGEKINGQYIKKLEKRTMEVKWKSEFLLYKLVYMYFEDAILHYSAEWLGNQHLDIFLPNIHVGIEYQGQQHYEPSAFFGGEIGFDDRKWLDAKKRLLCTKNNIILIEWPYSVPISSINFIKMLSEHGIMDVPSPNPFREVQSLVNTQESAPEEKVAIKICQYSIDGTFLKEYKSYGEASEFTGISKSSIHKAVTGNNKSAGGYQWRRLLSTDTPIDIEGIQTEKKTNKSKAVIQVSLDGELLAEFESIGMAERKTKINRKSIRCVLMGKQKSAGGFYWVYKE